MLEIVVKNNDVNIRLDNFLLNVNLGLTKSLIYKLIRTKKIKVNDKKTIFNYRLQLNDIIKIYYNLDSLKLDSNDKSWLLVNAKLNILYEDENIIVVNKPVGLLCHDDNLKSTNDTLINRIKKYLYTKKEFDPNNENYFEPSLVHRIDRNTSGIVIAAKNHQSLSELNNIFKNHLLTKKYMALVYGIIPINYKNIINIYIDDRSELVSVSNKCLNGYKQAITKYKVINNIKNKFSLLDIEILTGRKHQIRASLNYINHPIVGEQKYISKNINKDINFKYQCLVAYNIKFNIIDKNSVLYYLNKINLVIDDIWFLNCFEKNK